MAQPTEEAARLDLDFYQAEIAPILPACVLDFHTHIWDSRNWRVRPWDTGVAGAQYMVVQERYPAEALLSDLRRSFPDRDHRVIVFGYPAPVIDPACENGYVAGAARRHGMFPLMIAGRAIGLDPDTLERDLRAGGFYGYKAFLNWFGDDYGDLRVEDMLGPTEMGLADALGLVVLLHVPGRGRLADPAIQRGVERLAKDYPRAQLVLAHCDRCYLPAQIRSALGCLGPLANVYLDTAMVMDPLVLAMIFDTIGPARVLYGTDFPVAAMRGRRVRVMDHWVDVVVGDYPASAYRVRGDGFRATFMALEIALAVRDAAQQVGLSDDALRSVFHDNGMAVLGRVTAAAEAPSCD